MRGTVIALVLAGSGVVEALGQDDASPAEVERPRYTFLRYKEDWSVLRGADPATLTDLWDPIKYIPLNEDGSMWVSFGGSTRLPRHGHVAAVTAVRFRTGGALMNLRTLRSRH